MKTKSRGIRLPIKLYELVCSAEPTVSFNDKVICALKEKYDVHNVVVPTTVDDVHSMDDDISFSVHKPSDDIDKKLDKLFGCAQ